MPGIKRGTVIPYGYCAHVFDPVIIVRLKHAIAICPASHGEFDHLLAQLRARDLIPHVHDVIVAFPFSRKFTLEMVPFRIRITCIGNVAGIDIPFEIISVFFFDRNCDPIRPVARSAFSELKIDHVKTERLLNVE